MTGQGSNPLPDLQKNKPITTIGGFKNDTYSIDDKRADHGTGNGD